MEKPAREVADTMVQSSEYLWNSGMFVWTTQSFFRELEQSDPKFISLLNNIRENKHTEDDMAHLNSRLIEDDLDEEEAFVVLTATNDAASVAEDSGANAISVLANDSFAPDTGETLLITAKTNGYLITMRAPCLTQQGDCVAVIAQPVSAKEVMKA